MTGTLLRAASQTPASVKTSVESFSENEVFFCPEESHFYSHCLERLVFNHCSNCDLVVEFGSGDGSPVINSLKRARFDSVVHGYELNLSACEVARSRVSQYNLHQKYKVHNESFFDSALTDAQFLIANPPYLPAPDNQICMPLLYGGEDGAAITNKLLTLDYPNVMVLVSSYSNPVNTIEYGLKHGYGVADFMVTPLKFGYYSSEPKVKNWIAQLRENRQAFYSENIYFLAGVLFKKQEISDVDIADELVQVMTAL